MGCLVHPHVRGDRNRRHIDRKWLAGSPPRAWGQVAGWGPSHSRLRFTPTCVGTGTTSVPTSSTTRVHPHVRGDRCVAVLSFAAAAGSPPRAWGQAGQYRPRPAQRRFTPTCVGTGPARCTAEFILGGSPPRAWGQGLSPPADRHKERFTPTCVGTGTSRAASRIAASVHPHVRGDREANLRPAIRRCGSPPRAWGQVSMGEREEPLGWFTPTCVGTGAGSPQIAHTPPVHPHVRGDRLLEVVKVFSASGSPPRAWGQA